jgi:cobalt/nickel transport protein
MKHPDRLLLASALLIALAGLFWNTQGSAAKFGGTDQIAAEEVKRQSVNVGSEPFWRPPSAEVESGLFALQAAIGGALTGYVIGRLHGKRSADAS